MVLRLLTVLLYCFTFCIHAAEAAQELVVLEARKETMLSGYTRSDREAALSAEVSGKVLRVTYDVGETIGSSPFIIIDPTFVDFQLDSTIRSLDRLDVLIRRDTARVTHLQKEALRIERLFADELATEATRDTALHELDQARFDADAKKKEKSTLQTTLKELKERRKRHTIYAPRGWIVTGRNVEEHEVVHPGEELARIADFRSLVVPLYVSGEELSAIRALPETFAARLEGRPATVSLSWMNPDFDEESRKLKIELRVVQYNGERRGGLKLDVPVSIGTAGIFVPRAAVTTRYENATVTVRDSGETVQLLLLGDSGDFLIAADDDRLPPGTVLLPPPASTPPVDQ